MGTDRLEELLERIIDQNGEIVEKLQEINQELNWLTDQLLTRLDVIVNYIEVPPS